MADAQQVERLLDSANDWNTWRAENPQEAVDLSGADLSRADLIEADLSGADLRGALLVSALLLGADLSEADLRVTDLRGADLRAADLSGADLSESFFLTQAQVVTAKGDPETKLSPRLTRPGHWKK